MIDYVQDPEGPASAQGRGPPVLERVVRLPRRTEKVHVEPRSRPQHAHRADRSVFRRSFT